MAMHMSDPDEFGENAPQPVDAGSVERGAFGKLEGGQGAVSAASGHRARGAEEDLVKDASLHMDKRTLALIVGGAVAVIAIIVVLFVRVLDAPSPSQGEQGEVEQTAVSADESVKSHGTSYEFEENGGKYSLVEVREGDAGQRVVLGELRGVPVSLVLYDGAIVVPENLTDGAWDVMAYTIGSGWSQIMDQEGNAIGGDGTITEASLEGSTVVLVVDGQRVDVPLVW